MSIKKWHEMSIKLKELKAEEMKLRKDICADILQGLAFPCRKTVEIDGLEVKAENNVSYAMDEAALNQVYAELTLEDRGAFKYKPSLVMATYKKLPESSLLHEIVTSKPTSPILKVL